MEKLDTKKLLLELSARTGVAGGEGEAVTYAADLLRPFGPVETTPLGSLLCTVRPAAPGAPHILLDAHIDEIGMVVTAVGEEGFLRVGPCGGMDRRLLWASPVQVHAESGPIPGVVCSVPPHLDGDEEKKNQKVEDLWIDVGLDRESAEKAVRPGDLVTLRSYPRELLGDQVSGKAIDDRAGCVAQLKAVEYLQDEPLDCGVTLLFSTMEEVGGQGAKTAAYRVAPTHAIAVDVSFAYTPDARKEQCGLIKKGPMIGFSPILDGTMSRELVETAEKRGIPFQREVMGGRTGTNADHIAVARGGVKTALLSVPQKYMHTPIELVAVSDVEDTARLIAAYIIGKWGGNK